MAANPADRDLVLRAGLARLMELRRAHTLVVNYPIPHPTANTESDGGVQAALRQLSPAAARAGDYDLPNRLPLAATWSAFVAALGPDTRRNLRRYPQRARDAGLHYVAGIEPREFRTSFEALRRHANRWDRVDPTRVLDDSDTSILRVGLRSSEGCWVSLLAGWCHGERAFALTQLNDARHPRASLSMVLRAALIQDLIRRGVRELVFLDGCAGALSLNCRPEPVRRALIDVRGARGRLAATLLGFVWPRLASRLWTRSLGVERTRDSRTPVEIPEIEADFDVFLPASGL